MQNLPLPAALLQLGQMRTPFTEVAAPELAATGAGAGPVIGPGVANDGIDGAAGGVPGNGGNACAIPFAACEAAAAKSGISPNSGGVMSGIGSLIS